MIDRIIGNGNLPNVYISQIEVKDSNRIAGLEKMIKISLTLVVKDKKINGNFQWSQNGFMTDFLLINLLQSTNQNFSNQITNGDFTILKSDYKIINTNWYCHWGEIDIVAMKNQELIFVEVKYRRSNKYVNPILGMTAKKLNSLNRSIYYFLKTYNLLDKNWRLDFIGIREINNKKYLQHIKNINI